MKSHCNNLAGDKTRRISGWRVPVELGVRNAHALIVGRKDHFFFPHATGGDGAAAAAELQVAGLTSPARDRAGPLLMLTADTKPISVVYRHQ